MLVGAAALARDLGRLVLPVECPGCGRPDERLCGACAAAFAGPPVRCEADVPRLDWSDLPAPPVWRLARYEGPVRGVVVGWKDRGRADLTGDLVRAAERAGAALAPALAGLAGGPGGLLVVPVPTTPAARRRRGADLVRLLAAGLARGLAAGGVAARVAPVLRRRRRRDQVGLGARARGRNSAGSFVPARRARGLRRAGAGGCGVALLVDDVVTTGATLAACRAALAEEGVLVAGAVVLAATPPPSGGRVAALLPGAGAAAG